MRSALKYFAMLLLAGCSLTVTTDIKRGVGTACSSASDCQGDGATCNAGTCTLACAGEGDCPSGSSCNAGFCRVGGATAGATIGAKCQAATECQSGLCEGGLCTQACTNDAGCNNGSRCITGKCQQPMRAAFMFDGVVSNAQTGFALTHELGRQYATDQLKYLTTDRSESNTGDTISGEIDRVIKEGADVVVVTTSRFGAQALEKAKANPTKKFAIYATNLDGTPNISTYFGRYHQAWYISGVAAARASSLTQSKTIGFLAAIPNSEVIRQLNAFTLGVRRTDPSLQVEVVWMNSFVPSVDATKKGIDYLVAGGSQIVVNRMGARNAEFIQYAASKKTAKGGTVYSVSLDNQDACTLFGASTCIGGPYWNWGPLYAKVLDDMHRGTWESSAVENPIMLLDPKASVFHYTLNTAGVPQLETIKENLFKEIPKLTSDGVDNTFTGPLCATMADQRPAGACIGAGERIDDAEQAAMCWLIDGLVQRADPEDPASALDIARAPDGTRVWPPKAIDPNAIDKPKCQ